MNEFLRKYGTRTLSLLVAEFIEKSPSFEGDLELAAKLGEVTMDLEIALAERKSVAKVRDTTTKLMAKLSDHVPPGFLSQVAQSEPLEKHPLLNNLKTAHSRAVRRVEHLPVDRPSIVSGFSVAGDWFSKIIDELEANGDLATHEWREIARALELEAKLEEANGNIQGANALYNLASRARTE